MKKELRVAKLVKTQQGNNNIHSEEKQFEARAGSLNHKSTADATAESAATVDSTAAKKNIYL